MGEVKKSSTDSNAIIAVGDTFSTSSENCHKGFSKEKNYPYIFFVKKAERGYASVKMFVKNATECINAQSVTVKCINEAVSCPRKTPNGKFYTEFKITAECTPHDVFEEERKKTSDEFMDLVNAPDKGQESGLFDKYEDGNFLPFS